MIGIENLVEKLSQYNFLTNIIPGTVLCLIIEHIIGYHIIVVEGFFQTGILFYFVGLVNNRFGSVVIERLCKAFGIVSFCDYDDFVTAEKKDPKIATLSTENNVFRAYISVCVISLILYACKHVDVECLCLSKEVAVLLGLLFLFVLSYRKQTEYVKKRVKSNIETEQK